MTVYESTSVLTGVISFAFFGALAGGIYSSINTLRSFFFNFLTLPFVALCSDKPKAMKHKSKRLGQVLLNLSDLVYFIIIGAVYILLTYICFDMEIRIYPLLIFLIAFFISKRYLGDYLGKLISYILDRLHNTFFILLFYIFRPLRRLFFLTLSFIKPIYFKLNACIQAKMLEYTLLRKEKELKRFFDFK